MRFFHRELDRRYSPEYLERIPEVRETGLLAVLDASMIEHLKGFFKRVMYPSGEHRELRDRGMETVASILGSAGSLIALLPQLPGMLVRHGARLPEVSRAALELISAYRLSNRLERKTVDVLAELCDAEGIDVEAGDEIPEHLLRRAYATLSEEDTRRMVERTETVARLGMKRQLMYSTREITRKVKETRTDPGEREALDYVISVLGEIHDLAGAYSREQIESIVHLSVATEHYYFAELRGEV